LFAFQKIFLLFFLFINLSNKRKTRQSSHKSKVSEGEIFGRKMLIANRYRRNRIKLLYLLIIFVSEGMKNEKRKKKSRKV
jgi:hypothetical protein